MTSKFRMVLLTTLQNLYKVLFHRTSGPTIYTKLEKTYVNKKISNITEITNCHQVIGELPR